MFMNLQNPAQAFKSRDIKQSTTQNLALANSPKLTVDLQTSMLNRLAGIKSGCGACGK